MLIKNLPLENLPQVKPADRVYTVLEQMYQYHVQELPVTDGGKFIGLIKEETLLNADDDLAINDITRELLKISVNGNDHLLKAVAMVTALHLSLVPVVESEDDYLGVVEAPRLLEHMADFMHLEEPGALIVLEIDPLQYSFSEISKIVETNDAEITQLNTSRDKETGAMQVTIRVNKMEVSDIVATFQRYEYYVKHYFGEELYTNELKNNYENLMNYLNI